MTIRLDTYPEEQIVAQMTPHMSPPAASELRCLLHTGTLPPSQQVEVWVEGTRQLAHQEETQHIFSWTCTKGSEIRILLMHHGRQTKAWRGWWQGATTIAHTGTLAIQVYCAGMLQPAGLTSPTATSVVAEDALPTSPDQHNGTHSEAVSSAFSWPAVPGLSWSPLSAREEVSAEDDLWMSPHSEALPGNGEEYREEVSPDVEAEIWEEEQEQEEEEIWHIHSEASEATSQLSLPKEEASTEPHAYSLAHAAPAETMVAAMSANPVWSQAAHQEAEARLTALLATMPANTILVDLRQHAPTPRVNRRSKAPAGPQKLGLSKEFLRNRYGGRYWDRGATILTSRRLRTTHPMTWSRVITNPDDPDGLGTLVTALVQGCSLILLDGETKYAESARAAVLAELSQRVANLTLGSCC